MVKKPYKPVDLTIRKVTQFGYGAHTTGDIMVWAMGQAGWFELRPSRSYKNIFDTMIEAIQLLYFLADVYSGARKRGKGPNVQLVFQEYAEDERFECGDVKTAEQIFHKHHQFLIVRFLDRAEGIGWSTTPIYQYLKRQYPVSGPPTM